MSRKSPVDLVWRPVETQFGVFAAGFSTAGLARLGFPGARRGRKEKPSADLPDLFWDRQTAIALNDMLAGRKNVKFPPLDLSRGTPFQREVWNALKKLPRGQTVTYARLAAIIGRPGAARAVGGACGANPLPVFIPCHRVLAAGGGLGGFSAGLKWKRLLLELETGRNKKICLGGRAVCRLIRLSNETESLRRRRR